MRFSAPFVLAAAVLAGCVDQPLSPEASGEGLGPDPEFALLHLRNGGTAELTPPAGTTDVYPRAVNRDGTVVGTAVGAGGGRALLWRPASPFTNGRSSAVVRDLAPLRTPVSIDNDERIAGSLGRRAAIWIGGAVSEIGSLPGHDTSFPNAGSSSGGYVVGNSWSSAVFYDKSARGFRWSSAGMIELPPLPGDESSRATWVNSSGTVAGLSYAPDVGRRLIVVWKNGVPTSTGYSGNTNEVLGISDTDEVLLSSLDGNEVLTWRNGAVTRYPHPTPENPTAKYWGVKISAPGAVFARVEVDEPLIDYRFGRYAGSDFVFISPSPVESCPFFDWSYAICYSPMRAHPFTVLVADRRTLPHSSVNDLTVTQQTGPSVTLRWTEVDDGQGNAARYRVRYSEAPIHVDDWSSESRGCDVHGSAVGAQASCTITGLTRGVPYDFQLMSYRMESGIWRDAKYSTVGVGQPGTGSGGSDPGDSVAAGYVNDLAVSSTMTSSATIRWTQVDDGWGGPASYRLKYARPPFTDWKNATVGCDARGDAVGAPISCTVSGLASATTYEFQLMSYRIANFSWVGATYSNVTAGQTR